MVSNTAGRKFQLQTAVASLKNSVPDRNGLMSSRCARVLAVLILMAPTALLVTPAMFA